MTIENFQVVVEALCDRRAFLPSTIQLLDDQRFKIDYPHALGNRDGAGSVYFIAPGGAPVWFDHKSVSTILDNTSSSLV
jgi:hypothetical protein